ncbi:MAG: hypothetical protein LBT80_05280 [Lactobacillaceae bacterium]|jgi:hypothetical protein|nr:hypothetical protein [Lactobacillaceae bacterium]
MKIAQKFAHAFCTSTFGSIVIKLANLAWDESAGPNFKRTSNGIQSGTLLNLYRY